MDRLDQAPRSCFTFRRGSPRADEVVKRGKDDYLADELLQDAGDSLMMKLGEAPNRLVTARCFGSRRGRVGALAIANRNFIIHS